MFTLVFIALAASAILAAIAFSIAGRNAAFNYSVDEAQVQYEKMSAVIRTTTDDLTLEEIYNYILYPASVADREYLIIDSSGNLIYPVSFNSSENSDELAAIDFIKKRGCTNIKFMCIIAAPEGLEYLQNHHPDIQIYVGHLDRQLNENAYIVPGLGDAGDRIFGTK